MLVNQVLRSTGKREPLEYLIVDIDTDNLLISVTDLLVIKPKRPFVLTMDEVNMKLKSNEWELDNHDFPNELFAHDSDLKTDDIKMRNNANEAIAPLINNPVKKHNYLYRDSTGFVAELMQRSNRSKKYITTCLNRHFYYGGFTNSVLPTYYACGKNFSLPPEPVMLENGNVCLARKPGRETIHGEAYRYVTQKDVDNIKKFARQHIKNNQQVVLEELYTEFIAQFYTTTVKRNNIPDEDIAEPFRIVLERRHLISSRAFKRQLNKFISKLTWLRKRTGTKNFMRDHDGKPGSAHKGLRGPTSRYEIDSTILDIYLRYPYSNELLSIGRPILYLVIDVVTGMIVGMHVAFHGPDWSGASQALLNAFSDKVEFGKKFGINIRPEDWPCHHICRELTADRGTENTDKNIEALLKGLIGISVVNLNPYYMGSAKGTVEKTFDVVQKKALTFEAGKVEKVPRREDQHASRRALYTYEELIQVLIKTIINANNHTERINGRNFEMERDNCAFTSLAAWNYGLSRTVITKQLPKDRLIFALLPEAKAVIRAQGVYFRGLLYSSRDFEKLGKLAEAKNFGRKTITIRYIDSSTNSIWWRDDETKILYKLDLTERCEAYRNQIWESVLHRLEIIKHDLALLDEINFAAKVSHRMDLRSQERYLLRKTRHLKHSRAKSPAKGTKDRGAVIGEQQKYQYRQEVNETFSSPQKNQELKSANSNWGEPNAVPERK
ncbi:integrase [Vibrio parahaemolyticus]|nr:integrase [Vibrio parahaemolyticus]HCE4711213.1 integrase [Vibrio parahaemolyticus]HCG9791403.1 integrase [Vibrio parahaemolyticus]HCH4921160.1 integrase [Vibrio parahaemolyticus]